MKDEKKEQKICWFCEEPIVFESTEIQVTKKDARLVTRFAHPECAGRHE